jgi:hypothetical protein
MPATEIWELASYIVTVIGLPMAILVFVLEQRKQRQADHEEIYQHLSDEYHDFLKLVLRHPEPGRKVLSLALFATNRLNHSLAECLHTRTLHDSPKSGRSLLPTLSWPVT